MNDMLNDTTTYEKVSKNKDKSVMNHIKSFISSFSSILTRNETNFVTNFEYKTSLFYGLPKIHKSQQIKSAIINQNSEYILCENPLDLKFRPIVAGPACPTSKLSHLLDILLKPFLKHVKSYIKDTVHFLSKLPQNVNENKIFARIL